MHSNQYFHQHVINDNDYNYFYNTSMRKIRIIYEYIYFVIISKIFNEIHQ